MLVETFSNLPLDTTTILTGIVFIFLLLHFSGFGSSLFSPGPWGLPIVGYYPFIRKDFYRQFHEFSRKYGEVYTINIAGQSFVYLSSIRAIKEVNINKADHFTRRSNKFSLLQHTFANGILFMEGDQWKAQKKFFSQSMKEAGHNRNINALDDAVRTMLDDLHKTLGKPFNIFPILSLQTNYVLRRVLLGCNVSDTQAADIKKAFFDMIKPMNGMNFLLIGNFTKHFIFPRIPGFSEMKAGTIAMWNLLRKIVEDHKSSYDPNQPPRDFVDMYLGEREMRKRKGDPLYKMFSDEALIASLRQAYGDGSEGVTIFLVSFLAHLSLHHYAQDALYDEIMQVVGSERLPTLEDRVHLPLVNSALKELQRLAKFMTAAPGLECTNDTEILGVKVSKGHIVIINFWAVHHNPEVYKTPERFDINRFMPDRGKVQQPITFGVGHRACAGESFVMNEIFLFLTAIVQNFVILPETDEDAEDKTEPIFDMEILFQNKMRVIPRKNERFDSITLTTSS